MSSHLLRGASGHFLRGASGHLLRAASGVLVALYDEGYYLDEVGNRYEPTISGTKTYAQALAYVQANYAWTWAWGSAGSITSYWDTGGGYTFPEVGAGVFIFDMAAGATDLTGRTVTRLDLRDDALNPTNRTGASARISVATASSADAYASSYSAISATGMVPASSVTLAAPMVLSRYLYIYKYWDALGIPETKGQTASYFSTSVNFSIFVV
jgi:hypothetical protein